MTCHKYEVGALVRLRGRLTLAAEQSKSYVVTQWMPVEHGAVTYKIRSDADMFDRIADEHDLFRHDDDSEEPS